MKTGDPIVFVVEDDSSMREALTDGRLKSNSADNSRPRLRSSPPTSASTSWITSLTLREDLMRG
jgi:hypothetical protein